MSSDVIDADVSIAHRDPERKIKRLIYDAAKENGGQKFKRTQSQKHAGYDEELGKDWPVVNTYPGHILADPLGEVTKKEFSDSCGVFTVLSDFWKDWAMRLEISNRSELYKLAP